MLVGDIIVNARAQAPDLPAALGAPTIGAITAVAVAPFLPAATYQVKITQLNQWGESIASSEVASVQDGAHKMSVAFSNVAPATVKLRFYIGTGGAGSENQYLETTALTSPFVIDGTNILTTSSGIVPARSTAYLPDTDGARVSAYRIYTWFNQALLQGAKVTGGIRDVLGLRSRNGVGTYAIPDPGSLPPTKSLINQWAKFTDAWYDGYVMEPQNQRLVFRRNPIAALAWQYGWIQQADRTIVEIFPQANRDGGGTFTSSPVGINDPVINVTDASVFVLPLGLALLGTTYGELVYYNGINTATNQLTGVVRGLGGTVPSSFIQGDHIYECNIRLQGLRLTGQSYLPGNASNTLNVPDGWDGPLSKYILAQYKLAEQDVEGHKELMAEFKAEMFEFRANRYPAASQIPGDSDRQVYGSGLGGGWLIP